jgi:polar amino acid transport system substrate-binding protein
VRETRKNRKCPGRDGVSNGGRRLANTLMAALLSIGVGFVAGHSAAYADDAITAGVSTDAKLHSMLPKDIIASGEIKLGTDAHYPPCESFASDNVTMVGWEPDFWEALGKKLDVKFAPSSIDFDGLIPGVQSGRYDTAMECISDTPVREQQVSFVDLSISVNGIFALEGSKVTNDPLSYCGLKTAAQTGTTFGESVDKVLTPYCLQHGKPAIKKSEFANEDATLLALLSGRVDFVVNDASSAAEIKKHSPRPIVLYTPDILPHQVDGFVLRKADTQLAAALLAGTKALLADGTFDKIMAKWDLSALELKAPGINVGSSAAK